MDLKELYSKLEKLRLACSNSPRYDIQDRLNEIGSFLNNDLDSAIDAVSEAIGEIENLKETIETLEAGESA